MDEWQTPYIELRAHATKIATEIFQKKLHAGMVPETETAGPHLNQTYRGNDGTSHQYAAMPGLLHYENPRDLYVYCSMDDPVGHRFTPEGEKFGFMQHPSPISDFTALAKTIPWTYTCPGKSKCQRGGER